MRGEFCFPPKRVFNTKALFFSSLGVKDFSTCQKLRGIISRISDVLRPNFGESNWGRGRKVKTEGF